QATALRDEAHAATRDLVRGQPRDVGTVQDDPTAARRREPGDGTDECRLADSVPSEHRGDLPVAHAQGDTLHDEALAVAGVKVVNLEHEDPHASGNWLTIPPRPDRSR